MIAIFFATIVGVPVVLGFVAGLAFARPWTRWVGLGIIAAYFFVMSSWTASAEVALRILGFVAVIGALGYGAASLGIRLRRGTPAPRRA